MLMYAQDEYGCVGDEMIAGDWTAAGPEQRAGRRDAGILLDAAPEALGQAPRTDLHERGVHAEGRE